MIKIAIIGASGYSGEELIKILLNHPHAEIKKLYGFSSAGLNISNVHKSLKGIIDLTVESFDENDLNEIDLVFIALPSGESMNIVPKIFNKGIKIIDLGGDFRLKNLNEFEKYYKHHHTAINLLEKSVYGLSEWNESNISKAKIVANPGCYPTSIQLALLPLLKNKIINENFISITSYSGTSGAGKSVSQSMIFSEVNESVKAYKISTHQHIPEIKQYLKFFSNSEPDFSFIPHLLPATRGIYTTISAKINSDYDIKVIDDVYENEYSEKPFVRLYKHDIPELKDVIHTNFCDISWNLDENKNLILISAIDNLIKGAAGQAVQNMNIMFGLNQITGLLKCTEKKW
ncbi:MAG: N-acetyl-gamma-glutamyl-phosphate reductase [Melioribacteraceae bacterium]|nr:N-acetyl-gamma-glutamyl-phosphate reductase [Melioribacteraceae bacterium]